MQNPKRLLDNHFAAYDKLTQSIRRGTQHFDREHTQELFRDCICDNEIKPDCTLHGFMLKGK